MANGKEDSLDQSITFYESVSHRDQMIKYICDIHVIYKILNLNKDLTTLSLFIQEYPLKNILIELCVGVTLILLQTDPHEINIYDLSV